MDGDPQLCRDRVKLLLRLVHSLAKLAEAFDASDCSPDSASRDASRKRSSLRDR
jgi:hypothetical protein